MNINYRILWFEDQAELVKDDIGPSIIAFLEDYGFTPEVVHYENGDNVEEILHDQYYDLILTDLNLGDGHEAGEKLIQEIRNHKVLTEVLLYSGNARGLQKIIDNTDGLIERVSFAVGISVLPEKIKQIIQLTIKKVQHVNNLRGLVMAETSELDAKMSDILELYVQSGANAKLEKYIYSIVNRSIEDNKKRLEKIEDAKAILELIHSPMFDSDKKCRAINRLIEILNIDDCKACHSDYHAEIIGTRNLLAHVKEEIDSGETVLRSKVKMAGGTPFIFNDKSCIRIRKNIKKHSRNLDELFTKCSALDQGAGHVAIQK